MGDLSELREELRKIQEYIESSGLYKTLIAVIECMEGHLESLLHKKER